MNFEEINFEDFEDVDFESEYNDNFEFTEEGEKVVQEFINKCQIKQKELLNAESDAVKLPTKEGYRSDGHRQRKSRICFRLECDKRSQYADQITVQKTFCESL